LREEERKGEREKERVTETERGRGGEGERKSGYSSWLQLAPAFLYMVC
jgi:hypothetical protein